MFKRLPAEQRDWPLGLFLRQARHPLYLNRHNEFQSIDRSHKVDTAHVILAMAINIPLIGHMLESFFLMEAMASNWWEGQPEL